MVHFTSVAAQLRDTGESIAQVGSIQNYIESLTPDLPNVVDAVSVLSRSHLSGWGTCPPPYLLGVCC